MLNRIVLIGRLTRNPELRYKPQGYLVTSFALALDWPFKNRMTRSRPISSISWRGRKISAHQTHGRLEHRPQLWTRKVSIRWHCHVAHPTCVQ